MVDITDLADRGLASDVDPAQLTRRHANDGVVAFLRQELSGSTRGPHELASTTKRELDVVDGRTDRDARQRDRIADANRRVLPTLDRVADLQAERREDVALLAVLNG